MGDPFMEARAMALLEFGCPPMPIADGRRMENQERTIINSHDLISVFMTQAFKQRDHRLNSERKLKQQGIEDQYYNELMQSDASFDSIYAIMAKYTRDYLGCFLMHPFSVQDVTVLPQDHISPAMLNEIRDYHKALVVVHSPPPTTEAPQHHPRYYFKELHRLLCHKERHPCAAQTP
jgi:hypothetical protein